MSSNVKHVRKYVYIPWYHRTNCPYTRQQVCCVSFIVGDVVAASWKQIYKTGQTALSTLPPPCYLSVLEQYQSNLDHHIHTTTFVSQSYIHAVIHTMSLAPTKITICNEAEFNSFVVSIIGPKRAYLLRSQRMLRDKDETSQAESFGQPPREVRVKEEGEFHCCNSRFVDKSDDVQMSSLISPILQSSSSGCHWKAAGMIGKCHNGQGTPWVLTRPKTSCWDARKLSLQLKHWVPIWEDSQILTQASNMGAKC